MRKSLGPTSVARAVETAEQRTIEVAKITTARRDLSTEGEPSSRGSAVHWPMYDP
jgi:hypothetical protein